MKTIVLVSILLFAAGRALPQAPDFELQGIDNNYYTYDELKGEKLTMIDFWATWCKPCIHSIPELVAITSEYKSKGVNTIGINIDSPRNRSKVAPFSSSLKINYPVLLDTEGEVMKDFNVVSVPTLLILDEHAKIVYVHQGYKPGDAEEIRHQLDKLLKQ